MINPDAPKPFELQWHECFADDADAAYSKTKAAKLGGIKLVETGDVMWRALQVIGPLAADHDHWAGWHLGIGEETEKAAHMMAASPVLVHTLKQVQGRIANMAGFGWLRTEIANAIKLAETGEVT